MATNRITLLTGATGANGDPAEKAGAETNGLATAGNIPDVATIYVQSSAGSGTMTCTLNLWGQGWGATDRMTLIGALNAGAAIDETTSGVSNEINYCETLMYPGHFKYLYCEVATIGGTETAINVYVDAEEAID